MVIVNIQSEMVEMAPTYNENINNDSVSLKYILIKGDELMEINKITTNELQRTLKVAKNKISAQNFNAKLRTKDYKKILLNLETNVKMFN
jgi:exo-beta-1,3-glucanase (GH17 family)